MGPRAGLDGCGNDPVTIVYKDGWALGPVWTGVEIPFPIGIRTPDRPARSESYPAHNRSASGIFQVFRQTERLTLLRVTVRVSHRGQSSDLCGQKRPDNGT